MPGLFNHAFLFKREPRINVIGCLLTVDVAHHPNIYNKHFEVHFNPSSRFIDRSDIQAEIEETCLSSPVLNAPTAQRIFVINGLGGSGKTQLALKFAHDYRGRYVVVETSSR